MRGLSRAATIIDSLRRIAATSAGRRRRRRHPAGQSAGVRRRAHRLDDAPTRSSLAMNAVQYDAVAVGNHEFNYGLPALDRAVQQADFPFLAANVYNADGTPRFRPWAVSTRRGIKIAIVGATTPGSMVWDRDNLAGPLVDRRHRPGGAHRRARSARRGRVGRHRRRCTPGLNEPSSYDTVSTGVPSENVAARLAREVPGIDLHRVRTFAQGDGRHGHRRRRCSCSRRTGRRASRSRICSIERQGTALARRRRSEAQVVADGASQGERAGARGHAGRPSRDARVRDRRRSAPRPSPGAPTRRASSTRR